jgi:uncharacterized protein YdaL
VSIDPADHLAAEPDAAAFVSDLVEKLEQNGVNTVYVSAYNVEYGAYYRTDHLHSTESEYGRQDLLGKLLAAAHARGIRVVAALYDHQHRGAWEARPDWRAKTSSGGDYNPPGTDIQYYLSTGNPEAAAWWRGFLRDLLDRYPDLDGIELREPIVNWWGPEADYNPAVSRAFLAAHPGEPLGGETWRDFRADMLTGFLKQSIALIRSRGLFVHVTTVATTAPDGALMPASYVAYETGFDLDGLLGGPNRPDAIKVELIWQQWARAYGRIAFSPEWTRDAARAFLRQVGGRTETVVHVELTDFGRSTISVEEFLRTLRAADLPRAAGVDFYSLHLADVKGAWPAVRAVFRRDAAAEREVPADTRVLVLFDSRAGMPRDGAGLARLERAQLANLLDHFEVKWQMQEVESYSRGGLLDYDVVFYLGAVYGTAPVAFVSDVSVYDGTVVWIGQNLFQLGASGTRLPFSQRTVDPRPRSGSVAYRGVTLPARGEAIATEAGPAATVVASLHDDAGSVPYVLRAGRFWYVTGSPFTFLDLEGGLNGRYLVFADLLHDMLAIPHRTGGQRALVRLEDVDPLTEPETVRTAVAPLAERGLPFLVSVTPFHVDGDPATTVPLSERPELAAALRDAVAAGGAIVLDGSTHQYRGRTGADAEFWDLENGGGVAEDGDGYVRPRIERALEELWRNDLHPLAWETPFNLATAFDYNLFSDYFTTFVERRLYGVWRDHAYRQPVPYVVDPDLFGGRIVPENLGRLDADGEDVPTLGRNAADLRVVRDAFAGVGASVEAPPAAIGRLADGLETLGYEPVDLYALPNRVAAPGRVELSGSGTASLVVPSGWVLSTRVIGRDGEVLRQSAVEYPEYARPTRTYRSVPGDGLVSMRVVPPGEEAQELIEQGKPGPSLLVMLLVYVAIGGIAVLAVVFAARRLAAGRAARR